MATRFCKIEKEGIIRIPPEGLESAGLETGDELEVKPRRDSLVLTKKGAVIPPGEWMIELLFGLSLAAFGPVVSRFFLGIGSCRSPIPCLLGYLISVYVGSIITRKTVNRLKAWAHLGGQQGASAPERVIVGLLERFLYTTTWLMGKEASAFIGIWLVLKTAGQWGRWGEEEGRAIYNVFLVGSALSLIFGVLGALLIKWLAN